MKQSTSSSVMREREGDVIGDDNDAFHQTSSSRNHLFTKQSSKRKTRHNTVRSFHTRVAILHAILVLVSRNGVGVAAQDTLALVLQTSNETTDEIPLEIMPEDDNETETQVDIPDYFFPQPSATPSIEPSMLPSVFPSSPPTISIEPSMVPSVFPSSLPSTIPTMYPTVTPVPTDQPSAAPTDLPSSTPSEMPSMTPTLSCHDVAAYRSPINNLTCEDHANTDCTSWRFLGLNISDLQELVESCPITCDVPCGYFTLLNSNISFVISNAPGLIDDVTSRTPLEEATREYLTDFIVKASPIAKFALTQVTLLSQQPLNSTALSTMENGQQRRLPPRLRRLANGTTAEEDSIHLQVILNLQGYKIYPIRIVLTDLLVAAIDSPDYTAQLRHAHSFFANVTASSAAMAQPRVVTAPAPPDDDTLSKIAIVAVTVFIACAAIIAAVLFVKHARARRGCKRGLPTNTEATPQQSTGSIRGNVFSFDLSPASSTGMGRLLAVFSSDSRASTSPTTSDEEAIQSSQKSTATEEHPYTGIIPPMVVIDNIEKPDPNASMMSIPETAHKKKKHIVPTKRMEASDSFIEALNNSQGQNQVSSSTLPEMMCSISSLESGPRGDSSNNNLLSPGQRALSAVLSGDGTNADDSSVSSTPVKGTDMHLDVAPRRTLSSGQLADEVDVDAVLDEFLMKRQWEYKGQNDDTSSEEDVFPTHRVVTSASYDRLPSKAPHANVQHTRSESWDKHSALDRTKVPRRPFAAKTTKQTSRRSFKRANSQTSLTSSRNSGTSPTHKRSQSRASSRGSQSSAELFAPDSEILYVYETSHRGYLGLAIEPCRRGTRIKAVKDYSPLFGLVEAGDRIVNVDGVDITYKTTAGVAELLKRKQGRNKKIRLTVARKTNETGGISTLPIMTRSRSKSLGSSVHVPSPSKPAAPTHYSRLSPVTGLVSSITELTTSPTGDEPLEEEEEVPFHFIGAAASEDPDYESFSDPGF